LSSIIIVFEFKILPVTTKMAESHSKIKISQLAQIMKQTFYQDPNKNIQKQIMWYAMIDKNAH